MGNRDREQRKAGKECVNNGSFGERDPPSKVSMSSFSWRPSEKRNPPDYCAAREWGGWSHQLKMVLTPLPSASGSQGKTKSSCGAGVVPPVEKQRDVGTVSRVEVGQTGGLEVAVSMDWGVNSFCQTEVELRRGE